MRKPNNAGREISLNNVLSGNYITTNHEWKKLNDNVRSELFELFREFVAKTARGSRRARIYNASSCYLKNYGIFNRLVYNFERERVEYICGQDWDSEMATLRDCFDGR